MANKEYAELLLDQRWKDRRGEILVRDGYRCVKCTASYENRILHVHHKVYHYGHMPWEYQDEELESLCYICHAIEHGLIKEPERRYQHLLVKEHSESYLTASQTHIDMLMHKLKQGVGQKLEQEILKNVVFLQKKRKEYLRG